MKEGPPATCCKRKTSTSHKSNITTNRKTDTTTSFERRWVEILEMVFHEYTKQRILFYYNQGLAPPTYTFSTRLFGEGINNASSSGILKFLIRCKNTGTIAWKPASGGRVNVTCKIKRLAEEKMRSDDETTAMHLHQLLSNCDYCLSTQSRGLFSIATKALPLLYCTISTRLYRGGISNVSSRGIVKFLIWYKNTGTIAGKPASGGHVILLPT